MRRRAFTLIELLIVVAIFAVISAILIPNFIRARQKGQERQAEHRREAPAPTGGQLPAIERGRVELRLTSRSRQVGLESVSGYEVTHQGLFTLRPASAEKTRLEFPFPREATSIREASLEFVVDGQRYEPENVVYASSRLVWVGLLPPGLEQVQVSYVATGQRVFVYDLPEATRLGTLEVAVTGDLSSTSPASGALPPTESGPDCLCWRFTNLVSRLPIALELTPEPSPLARVGTLFRLTGLAVLLFGLGLWYLGELYRPGTLRHFRLGGFFLLALSYSTFFMIFAVLGFHQDVSVLTAFWVALVCWAPPLVMHVTHVVDRHFALRLALPLGVFTLLLVVNGVYGGAWRDYVYVAAAVGTVAFLTTTYQRWIALRAEQAEVRAHRLAEQQAGQRALLDAAQELDERAQLALDQPDPKHLEPARRTVSSLHKKLMEDVDCASLLQARTEDLSRALARLESLRQQLPKTLSRSCCVACGVPGADGNFCASCGQPAVRPLACGGCQTTIVAPEPAWPRLHCPGCGQQLH